MAEEGDEYIQVVEGDGQSEVMLQGEYVEYYDDGYEQSYDDMEHQEMPLEHAGQSEQGHVGPSEQVEDRLHGYEESAENVHQGAEQTQEGASMQQTPEGASMQEQSLSEGMEGLSVQDTKEQLQTDSEATVSSNLSNESSIQDSSNNSAQGTVESDVQKSEVTSSEVVSEAKSETLSETSQNVVIKEEVQDQDEFKEALSEVSDVHDRVSEQPTLGDNTLSPKREAADVLSSHSDDEAFHDTQETTDQDKTAQSTISEAVSESSQKSETQVSQSLEEKKS